MAWGPNPCDESQKGLGDLNQPEFLYRTWREGLRGLESDFLHASKGLHHMRNCFSMKKVPFENRMPAPFNNASFPTG